MGVCVSCIGVLCANAAPTPVAKSSISYFVILWVAVGCSGLQWAAVGCMCVCLCVRVCAHVQLQLLHRSQVFRNLCGSVLKCVAVCCSVIQWVAVCCSVLQCDTVGCSWLNCFAVCVCVGVYARVHLQLLRRSQVFRNLC